MIARDRLSAWKRCSSDSLYMPVRISFSATCRRTGSVWSASHTWPIPPSPILLTSLYGPIDFGRCVSLRRPAGQGNCERSLGLLCAATRDAISTWSSWSCPQASSRNATPWPQSCSRAAANNSLIFSQRSCLSIVLAPSHFAGQPGFGHAPLTPHGRWGNTQQRCRFLHGKPSKEPQFYDLGLLHVQSGKVRQGVIQRDHIGGLAPRLFQALVEFDLAVRTAFGRPVAPGMVHQNLAHESGCNRDEVFSILRLKGPLLHQPQVCFVHQ